MNSKRVGFVDEQFIGVGENVLVADPGLEFFNDRFRERVHWFPFC
jgi:hypothetical protein